MKKNTPKLKEEICNIYTTVLQNSKTIKREARDCLTV